MKVIRHNVRSRDRTLKIETQGGVVFVELFTHADGTPYTRIEIVSDDDRYGENWDFEGSPVNILRRKDGGS